MSNTINDICAFMKKIPKVKDNEELTNLDLEVVNLTVLLQAAGFELEHFDYQTNNEDVGKSNQLKIEITCGHSNILSKLVYNLSDCTCPIKNSVSLNNSFWEVQGTDPNKYKPNKLIKKTSSNLIPEFSKESENCTKLMLAGILKFFKLELNSEKEQDTVIKKCNNIVDTIEVISSSFENSPMDGNNISLFSTPLSSINITPINGTGTSAIPQIVISSPHKHQTPPAEGCTIFFNELIINESMNKNNKDTTCSGLTSPSDYSDDRDTSVIQSIMEARQKLDAALIFMKLNLTQNITQHSLPKTPKTPCDKEKPSGLNFNTVNRRMSLGSIPVAASNKFITKLTSNKKIELVGSSSQKMLPPVSTINSCIKKLTMPSKILKSDTPRPLINKTKSGLLQQNTPTVKSISKSVSNNINAPKIGKNLSKPMNVPKVKR